jgi:hypothetical protein
MEGLMLISRSNSWEVGTRKRTVKKELKIGPVSVKFITIALLALGALFYLAQSSQGASEKYQIMQLSESNQNLVDQTKDLQVEAARLKSLDQVKKSTQNSNLVPIDANSFYNNPANHS